MGPNQTLKLLYSKGNHQFNKCTSYGMGENISKDCDWQRFNMQTIKTAYTTQWH